VCLRVLVFALATQTSGFMRDAADVISALATGTDSPDADDDCLKDCGDCHCPPGCPNCHCSHGVGSLPQTAIGAALVRTARRPDVMVVAYDARLHPVPEPGSVYRPPRADVCS
jgi:hypothetical protein